VTGFVATPRVTETTDRKHDVPSRTIMSDFNLIVKMPFVYGIGNHQHVLIYQLVAPIYNVIFFL
jgi:hypothetical protein